MVNMVTKKQVILIPYWMQEVVNRNNLSLADYLDIAKLKEVTSINDLAGFYELNNQQHFQTIFGSEVFLDSFLSRLWLSSAECKGSDVVSIFNTVESISQTTRLEVVSRLFNPDSRTDMYEEPFAICDINQQVCGLIIYPGFFNKNASPTLQLKAVEAIIKVLCIYDSYSEVAKSQLFNRYLVLLSNK